VEGRAIGDRETLIEQAAKVGIDPERVRAALDAGEFSNEVRADEREASELGINGVPFFVINRRYGVSGAQPPDLLLKALHVGWEDTQS